MKTSLLLLIVFTSLSAQAAEPIFAGAVTRDRTLRDTTSKIEESLSSAFELTGGQTLVSNEKSAQNQVSERDLERLISDARGRYLEGDFKAAVSRTKDAIERFESEAAFQEGQSLWSLYTEMLLIRALAEGRISQNSKRTLRKLAAVRPDYVPDPGLTPPDVMSNFNSARDEVVGQSKTLSIKTEPAGGEIFIDGISRGRAPLSLELPKGKHFVSARGGRVENQQINLNKNDELSLSTGDARAEIGLKLLEMVQDEIGVEDLGEQAAQIGDDVFVALVENQEDTVEVFLGRFQGAQLVSISGLDFRADLSDVDDAAVLIAQNAVNNTNEDRFIIGSKDASEVRTRFLGQRKTRDDPKPDEGGSSALLWAGVGGATLLAVAAGVTIGAIVIYSAPSNAGKINVRVNNNL